MPESVDSRHDDSREGIVLTDLLAVRSTLSESAAIVLVLSIVALVGWSLSWLPDSPTNSIGPILSFAACVLLGGLLGHRAATAKRTRPVRLAFGVAWRIAAIWVILASVAEYIWTDQTSTATLIRFPSTFILALSGTSGMFLVTYFVHAMRHNAVLRRDVFAATGILISLVLLALRVSEQF